MVGTKGHTAVIGEAGHVTFPPQKRMNRSNHYSCVRYFTHLRFESETGTNLGGEI